MKNIPLFSRTFCVILSLLMLSLPLFVQAQSDAQKIEKNKKRDLSYLKKITRLGPQKSGVLSFQDMPNLLPKSIFSKKGKALPFPAGTKTDASINVFLIHKNGRIYLIDSGMGGVRGEFVRLMEKLDVKRAKVHAVLLTHVHPDHIGGLVTLAGKCVFPNALIYLSRKEYDSVTQSKSPMYKSFAAVRKAYGNRIRTFEEGNMVENTFKSIPAYGHTPGHTVFEYGKYLFIGDILHSAELQFADPEICASFDMDKSLAAASRKKILALAAQKDYLIAGAHIPFPGTGKVEAEGKGFYFTAAKE